MITYGSFILITVLQLGLLAQATDLLAGHAGRVGTASVLFAALAGYAYALLTVCYHYDAWASVMFALLITAVLGAASGWLLLRLRGTDFLLGTLAAQMGFIELANNLPIAGGPLGIRDIPSTAVPWLASSSAQDALWFLVLTLAFSGCLLHYLGGWVRHFARLIHWARDDDVSARAFGISVQALRLVIFTLHAVLGGVAGIGIVVAQGYIGPGSFDLWLSITVLTVVYLSGTGGHPMLMYLGATVFVAISEFLRSFGSIPELVGPLQQIVASAILIAILAFRPRGLAGPVIETGPSAGRLE